MTTTLVNEDLTYRIIGAAIEVHRVLGSGFLESVYEEALCYEVDCKVIVGVKAIQRLTAIEDAQLLNYLRVTGMRVGLLFNFGASRLEFRRRIH